MYLIERLDRIKENLITSNYPAGSIERIFEYNERCKKNKDGTIPQIIKLSPEEKKKKITLN